MLRRLTVCMLSVVLSSVAVAENWPNWRGPSSDGVAPGDSFPTKWGVDENVAWKFPMPGPSGSTPVVWNERIFLTCNADDKNVAICLDESGKQLWRTNVGVEREGRHRKASGANSSPVTDGEHVFVYYKSGDLACLDFAGKIVWQKNLQKVYGEDTLWWDLGTSPALTKDAVVIAVMQTGPSYLVALDKASGEELWKQDRILDAPLEAAQSYSTPIVTQYNGKEIIVVLGADHVTCHDGATGKERWRVGGLNPTKNKNFRSIASPVINDGVVVAPYARGATVTAIKLGGQGDVTDSQVIWSKDGIGADVPTPTASAGRAYICSDKGTVTCVEVATGKEIWSVDLPKGRGNFSSSPILANGRLYVSRENATTYVLDATDGKTLATNELSGFAVATPVMVNGRILLQTDEYLYCIGK